MAKKEIRIEDNNFIFSGINTYRSPLKPELLEKEKCTNYIAYIFKDVLLKNTKEKFKIEDEEELKNFRRLARKFIIFLNGNLKTTDTLDFERQLKFNNDFLIYMPYSVKVPNEFYKLMNAITENTDSNAYPFLVMVNFFLMASATDEEKKKFLFKNIIDENKSVYVLDQREIFSLFTNSLLHQNRKSLAECLFNNENLFSAKEIESQNIKEEIKKNFFWNIYFVYRMPATELTILLKDNYLDPKEFFTKRQFTKEQLKEILNNKIFHKKSMEAGQTIFSLFKNQTAADIEFLSTFINKFPDHSTAIIRFIKKNNAIKINQQIQLEENQIKYPEIALLFEIV